VVGKQTSNPLPRRLSFKQRVQKSKVRNKISAGVEEEKETVAIKEAARKAEAREKEAVREESVKRTAERREAKRVEAESKKAARKAKEEEAKKAREEEEAKKAKKAKEEEEAKKAKKAKEEEARKAEEEVKKARADVEAQKKGTASSSTGYSTAAPKKEFKFLGHRAVVPSKASLQMQRDTLEEVAKGNGPVRFNDLDEQVYAGISENNYITWRQTKDTKLKGEMVAAMDRMYKTYVWPHAKQVPLKKS
jgi:hypothetical protein